ncbi:MAG: cob(I)yrinic acid a,c-diamide adenosyltransferase [Candidatus Omnitrophota bacterium]
MGVRSGKGDKGFTDLVFHRHISKDSSDMRAIGDLDELNSFLGLIRCKVRSRKDKIVLEKIQRTICVIISEIAVGEEKKKKMGCLLAQKDAVWIKKTEAEYEKKRNLDACFCLPGGSELSAYLDIVRSVARRAERSVVGLLHGEKSKNENILIYLNCISDILFIMARSCGRKRKRRIRS